MSCNCRDFCWRFVVVTEEILTKNDVSLQWKMFEQFLTKYANRKTGTLTNRYEMCSIEICIALIDKLSEFRSCDIALSNLLIDLTTVLYFEDCSRSYLQFIRNFEINKLFSSDRKGFRELFAFFTNDKVFMELLCNYGLLSSLSANPPRLLKELELDFIIFIMHIADPPFRRDPGFLSNEAIRLVKTVLFCYEGEENYKRMFLALKAVQATQLNVERDYSTAERMISFLRTYFCGTQDALLSVFEVRSILYVSFILTNKLRLFDVYCQAFYELMPECPTKLEPRSLAHLARGEIRQSLNKGRLPLSSAVDNLRLPNRLKAFLLKEVYNHPKKRGNASSVTQSELALLLLERSPS